MAIVYRLAAILLGAFHGSSAAPAEPAGPAERIVGGSATTIQNYPYQVSVQYSGSHVCGGSIISENYVVTAAHCVSASAARLSVRAGSSFLARGGTVHRVARVTRHHEYRVNRYGVPSADIALIKVADSFKFDATRRAIDLFEADERAPAGASGAISGWGRTSGSASPPTQLQAATVPLVEAGLCRRAYSSFGGLASGQICAGLYAHGGKDACQGDSGGPLAVDGRLAGIVSWGNDCALAFFPGVYTEVAFFRQWINGRAGFA